MDSDDECVVLMRKDRSSDADSSEGPRKRQQIDSGTLSLFWGLVMLYLSFGRGIRDVKKKSFWSIGFWCFCSVFAVCCFLLVIAGYCLKFA